MTTNPTASRDRAREVLRRAARIIALALAAVAVAVPLVAMLLGFR